MDAALWMPRPSIAWIFLVVAGGLARLVALKRSECLAHPAYGAVSVVVAWLSFALLAVTMRAIPGGTACAVWTWGGAIAGIVLFGESMNAIRLASMTLIVLGIVGVKLTR